MGSSDGWWLPFEPLGGRRTASNTGMTFLKNSAFAFFFSSFSLVGNTGVSRSSPFVVLALALLWGSGKGGSS